jgi:MtN3 and saliva related transmembrane protein
MRTATIAARGIVLHAVDWIGWLSSLILLVTLGNQVRKQWRSGESQGVSRWLFIGQTAASLGFSVYSLLLGNWVFVVTNVLILVNALAGQWVTARNRRHQSASAASASASPPSERALASS